MICSKGGRGFQKLVARVGGEGGGAGRACGGDQGMGGGREFCRGGEREGEREETTAFSEGVAALRPGLRITLILCCSKKHLPCDLWEDIEKVYREKEVKNLSNERRVILCRRVGVGPRGCYVNVSQGKLCE